MNRASMLVASIVLALVASGCPAEEIDPDAFDFEIVPFDATAGDPSTQLPGGRPTCSPEAIVDLNASGVRNGTRLTVQLDTRNSRNDLHLSCALRDGNEIVVRYHVPTLAERKVLAVRATTVTDATIANALASMSDDDMTVPDPTSFDTVLGIRLACDARDLSCNDDAFAIGPMDSIIETRRSTAYLVGTEPEEILFFVVDGLDGNAGTAQLTVDEITELGVAFAPCFPIPPQRQADPTAPTAFFRCPHPGIQCQPGAAPDTTDLCLPVVPLGATCDPLNRTKVCDPLNGGVECATNPSDQTQNRCALPGTAPGALCRGVHGSADRCDAGLVCSEAASPADRDVCVEIRQLGEPCDPTPVEFINHCADGLRCCADQADAGALTFCRPAGTTPCFTPPN